MLGHWDSGAPSAWLIANSTAHDKTDIRPRTSDFVARCTMPKSILKMLLEVTLGCFRLLNVAFLGCSMLLEVFLKASLIQLYVTLRNLRYFAHCTPYPEPCTLSPEKRHQSPGLSVSQSQGHNVKLKILIPKLKTNQKSPNHKF